MTCIEQSRSREVRIYSWFLMVAICLLLLATGCAPSAEKPAKPEVEPSEKVLELAAEPVKPEVQPEKQTPPVELTLKFTPQDSTTYKVTTEAKRSIKGEGALSDASKFKGGTTSNRIEITFTQQIKSVNDNGNAVAEITIKGLKCLAEVKDNVILDFDSSREKNLNDPLGALIGQSYTIEITPAGEVSKVIDVTQARAAVKGSSSANERAIQLLSQDAIKKRHAIPALSACDKNQLRTGDNWSSIETFSFGMMGTKSYERIYTLKEIKDEENCQIAVVEMNAIPSAEMSEEQRQEQAMGIFSKMFDNTETYTGQLKMDLNAGKVKEYFEELRSEWVAVDPSAGQKGDEEPAVLRMAATRLYRIEKID